MSKFEVGDRVRSKFTGIIYNVTHAMGLYVKVTNFPSWWPEDRFTLISRASSPTKEQALKVLIDAGYTVTPPKPKLSGKVVIYKSCSIDIQACTKRQFDKYNHKKDITVLAIVDWTEGQGLTDTTEGDGI